MGISIYYYIQYFNVYMNIVAVTYLAKVREGKLFVHILVDDINLQTEFWQIEVEMTKHMHY